MRATCKAGEVPCAAEYSTTYNDVTARQCHVSSHGGENTITALTWEWPDEMDGKLSGLPSFFSFEGKDMRTSTAHQFLMKDLRTGPGML